MKVEDLVGGINDPIFGGTPEGKIFDPLGLGQDEAALYRRRVVEIKHGRICMVAFLGMTVGPADLVKPTHALLSPSADLHFDDIPGGIAAIGAVPAAGWFQIIALNSHAHTADLPSNANDTKLSELVFVTWLYEMRGRKIPQDIVNTITKH